MFNDDAQKCNKAEDEVNVKNETLEMARTWPFDNIIKPVRLEV